jgi:hypothetical protein
MLTKREDSQLVDAVKKGVDFLDLDRKPPVEELQNWRTKLTPGFRMSEPGHCVLGLIFGDFVTGCHKLGLLTTMATRFGFDIGDEMVGPPIPEEKIEPMYRRLERLWIASAE